eukprot:gene1016-1156_t
MTIVPYQPSPRILSKFLFTAVGATCSAYLKLCTTRLTNWDRFEDIMKHRRDYLADPSKLHPAAERSHGTYIFDRNNNLRPLITVSNHIANLDDPILWGNLPWSVQSEPSSMRWTLGAADILFTNPIVSTFFSLGKCIKIVRGGGIYQQGIEETLDRMAEGQWIHLFPEGKVNQSKQLLYFKWGVGRLIAESKVSPIILPIYHKGLEQAMPLNAQGAVTIPIPRPFKRFEVFVGEPFECDELVDAFKADPNIDTTKLPVDETHDALRKTYYKKITTRVETIFKLLAHKSELESKENYK